jgi:hypothetical protein
MNFGFEFQNEIAGIRPGGFWIVQQFARLMAGISGTWKIEHLDNGRHGDVIASSVTTPDLEVSSSAILARVDSENGSTSMATATATTIFTVPGSGMFQVFAAVFAAGSANYTASAVVMSDGVDARITANNGGLLALTLSGLNVQATQSSGTTLSVLWAYLRIGA